MNKIYTGLLFLAFAQSAAAQEFYFRAGAGYAIPQAGQTLDGTANPYNGTASVRNNGTGGGDTTVYNIKNASLSSGVQGYFGVGYMFSNHIGVQLDANFGLSNTEYTFDASNININGVPRNMSVVQRAKSPALLMPSLVIQSGEHAAKFYARVGLALPVSTKITEDIIYSNLPGTGALTTDDFTIQLSNSFSMGFIGAAGIRYKLNDKMSIWGEASFLSMSLYLKEADVISVSENGQGVPLSQVSPLVIKYSRNAVVDPSQTMQPTYSQPFSNFGLNVGVNISLSGSSDTHSGRFDDREESDHPRGGRFH